MERPAPVSDECGEGAVVLVCVQEGVGLTCPPKRGADESSVGQQGLLHPGGEKWGLTLVPSDTPQGHVEQWVDHGVPEH